MRWIRLLVLTLASGSGQSVTVPAFEVASVKPHIFPKGTFGFSSGAANVKISGNRVTATLANIQGLLIYAYGVKDYQIIGVTKADAPWSDFYDIAATTPGDDTPSEDQVRQMVQGLLAERFQLTLHRETKVLPVYDLIVGKNGSKLKESARDTKSGISVAQGAVSRMVFSNEPISELVRLLNLSAIDRPVLDKTGLTGSYDFTLEFSRGGSNGDAADPDGTSIFTAVQEQLGLKLDRAKEPTEVLVIDHVESRPSAN
jgi:uncharacterized protein (TIGR03435 family)